MRENDLIGYLSHAYLADDSLWQLLGKMPVNQTLRRGQMHFQDSYGPEAFYIHHGIVKGFYYDESGREHVTRFWAESQIILLAQTDWADTATADHLQALEPTTLTAINYKSTAALNLSANQIARFTAKILLADRNMAELKAHLCALPARSAYIEFNKYFPNDRINLRDIASFLGITPQTISEIRKTMR